VLPIGIISLLLAFAATLYPSWRASRVNPAEALRYE
jgi:lipoprotein-releasing system permease protein